MSASEKSGKGETGSALVTAPVEVERAVADLRRGLPVLVIGDGRPHLVAATEIIDRETLAAIESWSGARPDILLTHHRASTLKIRLYTPEAVAIPLEAGMRLDAVRALADPTGDLDHPLQGPFFARRDPLAPAQLAGLHLAKLSGLLPSVVAVPMETGANPRLWAAERRLLAVPGPAIHDYEINAADALSIITSARVPLDMAEKTRIVSFRPGDGGQEHLAIVIGEPPTHTPVLARLHSECFTGDLLGSLKCDCGQQLRGAIAQIAEAGSGVLLYLSQEGRGIGLTNKLRAYHLQDQGFDTVEANLRLGFEADERVFKAAAQMLRLLGHDQVRLMTNNPDKVEALERFGVTVTERVPHAFEPNEHNLHYLETKARKSGHFL